MRPTPESTVLRAVASSLREKCAGLGISVAQEIVALHVVADIVEVDAEARRPRTARELERRGMMSQLRILVSRVAG